MMAFGMGNIMAPSTDSVLGAVPEANAEIASPMTATPSCRCTWSGCHWLHNEHGL